LNSPNLTSPCNIQQIRLVESVFITDMLFFF
jgi:hypothetical protein